MKLGGTQEPARIAASIVSGVGFLGAGAIMRGPIRVAGLTTASTIWLAAALGVGVGAGQYFLSGGGAGLAVVVLAVFPRIEHWIDREHQICTYKVTCSGNSGLYSSLSETIRARGLGARRSALIKCKSQITSTWEVWGPPEGHRMLTEALLSNPEVEEFEI